MSLTLPSARNAINNTHGCIYTHTGNASLHILIYSYHTYTLRCTKDWHAAAALPLNDTLLQSVAEYIRTQYRLLMCISCLPITSYIRFVCTMKRVVQKMVVGVAFPGSMPVAHRMATVKAAC